MVERREAIVYKQIIIGITIFLSTIILFSIADTSTYTTFKAYNASPAGRSPWAGTEATSAHYTAMATIDNSYAATCADAMNDEPYWRFNFTINETISTINEIKINIKGYDNASETGTCYTYNFTGSAWISNGATPSSNAWINKTFSSTTNFSSLINSAKQLVVYCEGSNYDFNATQSDCIFIDYIEVKINYTTPPPPPVYLITAAPPNTTFIRLNDSLDLTINGTTATIVPVLIKINDGGDNYTAIITLNFSNNISANNIKTRISRAERKSFIHNQSTTNYTINTSLLIPRVTYSDSIFVCPNAQSLEEIYKNCPGELTINLGETNGGMTLSNITINGNDYYLLANVTGTGGVEGYPAGYTRCKNITINNPTGTTLNNFPVNLNITYDADMQSDFDDLKFYTGDCGGTGVSQYAELENKTDSANAYVWVKTNLTAGLNTLSMYYKNSTVSSGWDNGANVWDNNYVLVLHMNDAHDSSSYQNNGTVVRNVVFQTSEWSNGAFFNGSSGNAINISRPNSLNISIGTFEAWGNPRTLGVTSRVISKEASTSAQPWALEYSSDVPTCQLCTLTNGTTSEACTGTLGSGITAYNTWTHIVGIFNGTRKEMYFNGLKNVTTAYTGTFNQTYDNSVVIGNNNALSRYMNGSLDEVRISNIGRSAAWINMTYQLMAAHATWVTYGGEENLTINNTCTCPSPASNWAINVADHCNITSLCDITGFNLTFTNGTTTDVLNLSAEIKCKNKNFNTTGYVYHDVDGFINYTG